VTRPLAPATPRAAVRPRLIVITDTTRVAAELLLARVEALAARARPGTVMIQLRDRELAAAARLELGRRLREITRARGQWLAVNDRVDLALWLAADALHLGEGSVSVPDARRLWGDGWVSLACHDPEAAAPAGVDAVILSPIVAPRKGSPALGLGALERARRRLVAGQRGETLLVALGGVTEATAGACLAAGAGAVAAIGAALDRDDPGPLLAAVGALDGTIALV